MKRVIQFLITILLLSGAFHSLQAQHSYVSPCPYDDPVNLALCFADEIHALKVRIRDKERKIQSLYAKNEAERRAKEQALQELEKTKRTLEIREQQLRGAKNTIKRQKEQIERLKQILDTTIQELTVTRNRLIQIRQALDSVSNVNKVLKQTVEDLRNEIEHLKRRYFVFSLRTTTAVYCYRPNGPGGVYWVQLTNLPYFNGSKDNKPICGKKSSLYLRYAIPYHLVGRTSAVTYEFYYLGKDGNSYEERVLQGSLKDYDRTDGPFFIIKLDKSAFSNKGTYRINLKYEKDENIEVILDDSFVLPAWWQR